jgi:hypothetical protein
MTEYETKVIQILTALVNGQVALMLCQPSAQRPDIQAMIAQQRQLADALIENMPGFGGTSQSVSQ